MTQPKSKLRRCPPEDDTPNQNEAIAAGLAIINDYEPKGDSDFDKGMRLLQQAIRRRPNAPASGQKRGTR